MSFFKSSSQKLVVLLNELLDGFAVVGRVPTPGTGGVNISFVRSFGMRFQRSVDFACIVIEREPGPELSKKAASIYSQIVEKAVERAPRGRLGKYWHLFAAWLLRLEVDPEVRLRAQSLPADLGERLMKFHDAVVWYETNVDDGIVYEGI